MACSANPGLHLGARPKGGTNSSCFLPGNGRSRELLWALNWVTEDLVYDFQFSLSAASIANFASFHALLTDVLAHSADYTRRFRERAPNEHFGGSELLKRPKVIRLDPYRHTCGFN